MQAHSRQKRGWIRQGRMLMAFISMALAQPGIAQESSAATFTIHNRGKQIGVLKTSGTQTAEGFTYHLTIAMKSTLLVSMQLHVDQFNTFTADLKLVDAGYTRTINGRRSKEVRLMLQEDGKYLVQENGKVKNQVNGDIVFSSLLLYFKEPIGEKFIYSENHMQFVPISKVGEGTYILRQPDGKMTKYWFEKGVLQKLQSDSIIGDVSFVRNS